MTIPAELPTPVAGLIASPSIAHLATCGNGVPHVTPVWVCSTNRTSIEVNIGAHTKKAQNIGRNPNVCLSIVAAHDARLWAVIEGVVSDIIETHDLEHLDQLAQLYLGRPRRNPEMPRRILTIHPLAIHWWGKDKPEEAAW